METVTRKYVDLSLFVEACDHIGIKYGVVTKEERFDAEHSNPPHIEIYISRYAMNPNGFHVGYENYELRLNLVPMTEVEFNSRHAHAYMGWLVDLASADATSGDMPAEEDCNEEEPECTRGECECELYTHPDEDFVWQECDHVLQMILDCKCEWFLDTSAAPADSSFSNTWEIRIDGSIVRTEADILIRNLKPAEILRIVECPESLQHRLDK